MLYGRPFINRFREISETGRVQVTKLGIVLQNSSSPISICFGVGEWFRILFTKVRLWGIRQNFNKNKQSQDRIEPCAFVNREIFQCNVFILCTLLSSTAFWCVFWLDI